LDFEDNDPTNTQKARTTPAIALTPTGNAQGGYFFLSLITGRKISRQQWDELPMPDGIIATVERMVLDQEQPIVGHGAPLFEWAPGVAIIDNVEEPALDDDNDLIDITRDDGDEEPADDIEEDEGAESPTDNDYSESDSTGSSDDDDNLSFDLSAEQDDDQSNGEDVTEQRSEDDIDNLEGDTGEQQDTESDVERDDVSEHEAPDMNTRSMRPNRGRNYGHRFGHAMDNPASSTSYDETIPAS
jgi:hypothetical protein